MGDPIRFGETRPVTEPVSMRPLLIVGWGDEGLLTAWCAPDYPALANKGLREAILTAAREILESLEPLTN